jgi:hypothetical protein
LVVLERVRETKYDLEDQLSTKAVEIAAMNETDPRTYTGVTSFEGDELFIRKALSIYNSMESEPQIARGQDEVANPVGWNRMLGTLWGNVAPEFIRPELPPISVYARPGGEAGASPLYDGMKSIRSARSRRLDESADEGLFMMASMFGTMGQTISNLVGDAVKDIIKLDAEVGLQSERAPQHRMDEENEFTDIIT